MMRSMHFICLLFWAGAWAASAEEVPFGSDRWVVGGEEFREEEYLGRPAIFLHNASTYLRDVDFGSGTIEFDVAFSEARGFSGVKFHDRGDGNYENFYLRPHQSGNPDASQYQPVYNGNTAWQINYGEAYSAPLVYRFDAWQHVRIEIAEGIAAIYVDSDEPVLCARLERGDDGGTLGVSSGFAPAYFSGFRFDPAPVDVDCSPVELDPVAEGTVMEWSVSTPFDESRIENLLSLDEHSPGQLKWSTLEVGPHGFANLGKLASRQEGNTVFARFSIDADAAQSVPIHLGFSDRARVFVNGQLVYRGDHGYESMDYRYLGTVGWNDQVVAQLEPGLNVIAIAISESFGGWAIGARVSPASGIELRPAS